MTLWYIHWEVSRVKRDKDKDHQKRRKLVGRYELVKFKFYTLIERKI